MKYWLYFWNEVKSEYYISSCLLGHLFIKYKSKPIHLIFLPAPPLIEACIRLSPLTTSTLICVLGVIILLPPPPLIAALVPLRGTRLTPALFCSY